MFRYFPDNYMWSLAVLRALASGGHGSKVLISDGNYPHWTRKGPGA